MLGEDGERADGSELFRSIHPPNTLELNLTPTSLMGVIDAEEAAAVGARCLQWRYAHDQSRAAYEAEQRRTAEGRAALPPVETILSLDDMEVKLRV